MEVQDFFQCWKCVDFWLAVLSYSPNCGFASLLPAATYSHEILYGLEVFSFPALTLNGKLKSIPVSCWVQLEIRRSLELHVIRVCSEYWDFHNTKKTREPVAMPLPSTKKKRISGTKLQKRQLQKTCNPLHIQARILWHIIFHPTTLHTSWLEYWIQITLYGPVIAFYVSTKSPAANALRHSISGSSLTGNKPSKSLDWETALSWKRQVKFHVKIEDSRGNIQSINSTRN